MSSPNTEERRLSFGRAALDYATYRPSYPRAAVDWVLSGASRRVVEIADVGAGTGALSSRTGRVWALYADVTRRDRG